MTVKEYVKKAEGYLDQGLLEEAKVALQIVDTFLVAKQARELDTEMTNGIQLTAEITTKTT